MSKFGVWKKLHKKLMYIIIALYMKHIDLIQATERLFTDINNY